MSASTLNKSDYEEPCCPLKAPTNVVSIPIGRVIAKLDEYFEKNDTAGAERHLAYWLKEATAGNDDRGKLSVLNEQIGLFRKTAQKEKGLDAIEDALQTAEEIGLQNTVTMGTTFVNAATAYKSFDMADKALPLYQQAQRLYESLLDPNDSRLGGLYNNMALTVMAMGNFDDAEKLFDKAMGIMQQQQYGEIEMAITYCNMADLVAARFGTVDGETQIHTLLEKALQLLQTPELPHDGYYAFVCEKCAPTFGYYGLFWAEADLRAQAKEIYERA